MDKEEDNVFNQEHHQAEDLSAKMARKSKPIPPPLNLTAMGENETSTSPLKDFAMVATSPRSPVVQKNLPFRKRAHSYSSTQTSSECDSPESPRVPASPVSREPSAAPSPSPCPQIKSPLSSPTSHFFNKRFLQEPIKSLLPSPNTSASFFNNECDPIKSPLANFSFFRPSSDLLSLPMIEKNSMKSPLQTPTRSVFLQNHVDSTLFDIDKLPLKSPLNTPTRPGFLAPHDIFVMPEPISVKPEPNEHSDSEKCSRQEETRNELMKMHKDLTTKFRSEKENIAEIQFSSDSIKQEPIEMVDFGNEKKSETYDLRSPPMSNNHIDLSIKTEKEDGSNLTETIPPSSVPLDCHKGNYKTDLNEFGIKKEPPSSPLRSDERSQNSCYSNDLLMSFPYNHFIENKLLENYNKLNNKNFLISQNVGYYCSELTDSYFTNSSANTDTANAFASNQMQSNHHNNNNNNNNHHHHHHHNNHNHHQNELNRLSNSSYNNDSNNRLSLMKNSMTYTKTQTYNKSKNNSGNVTKRNANEKTDEEGGKKSKKDQDDERPRRPMNAFMLFAKHQRPLLIQQHPGKDNRAISVVLGTAWRELDASERADYVRRAAAMATEHKRRHPDCWKRRRVRVNINQNASGTVTSNTGADVTS